MSKLLKLRPFLCIAQALTITAALLVSLQDQAYCADLNIRINPMVELDFKTGEEIRSLRRRYALMHRRLLNGEYRPLEQIFGQITDNKPWWGILGLSYYGPGFSSIEGPSEESRFLVNPFLFVGLDIGHGLIVKDKNIAAVPVYPEPTNLFWNKDRSFAKARYNVSGYWQKQKTCGDPDADEHRFILIAYNARDFGFNYLYVDPRQSENILSAKASTGVALIEQMIHCGESCGYPGGCNNMSPDQPELSVEVDNVPALLYIKLWKQEPKDRDQAADMVFVIEMV